MAMLEDVVAMVSDLGDEEMARLRRAIEGSIIVGMTMAAIGGKTTPQKAAETMAKAVLMTLMTGAWSDIEQEMKRKEDGD
jgi:hypothetical protein